MRKWGLVITVCYALILLVLLLPMAVAIVAPLLSASHLWQGIMEACHQWRVWIPLGVFLSGQALLLFLSVDTSFKRLKPRAHILVSCTVSALLLAVLTTAGIFSFGFGVSGDKFGDTYFSAEGNVWGFCFVLWLLWGILFYFYFRDSSAVVTRILSWLLKGSVLELLIAVPCHIIVRRRHDCSAPIVTSFGIASGLAIMLLTFGPSVLFLYKKRLDSYPPRPSA
jgi:hypothetical protein